MPRQPPQIREATPQDAERLLELWPPALSRTDGGSARARQEARRALANLAADPDERLLVAEVDDCLVAAVKLSRGPLSPLSMESVVHTSFLVVCPQHRRHGYGHALMDAALTWAEEKDIDSVTAITDGNRETNRFFARLGLSTFGTVRHCGVAQLRKKLTAERGRVAGGGNRHLVEVLAQRRSMRRRQGAS